MATLQVVLASILGFTFCATLLILADRSRRRRTRITLSMVAAAGLVLQGALWSYVIMMFKALGIGGSYCWPSAALVASGAGTAWAVLLLATSLRRRTG
jgi:hypothetical protein